jgi:uncharacterized protein (TIGR04255 family)
MKERFEFPPLVELIAEIRWNVEANQAPNVPFFHDSGSHLYEEFFSRLLAELDGQGYGTSERMVPIGFPLMNQHPVIRYQKSGKHTSGQDSSASTLFQAGVGIFTVNAVQPYKSWEQFRPVVEIGLQALMSSAPNCKSGFTVSLRYVDAFKEELTEGRTHRQFLEEILGIQVIVPESLRKISVDGSTVIPMLHMVTPLSFGTLQIQFAEGELSGEKVFLMENVVTVSEEYDGDVAKMMHGLDQARAIVHESFVGMTRPLHTKMKLSEGQ